MENKFSGKYFQLTVCFNGFDPKMVWSENFHFKPFPDPRVKAEREREREREEEERVQSSNRAPIRRPQTELQFDDPHSTGLVDCNHADQAKIDSNATRSRLRRAISPSHPPHNLTSRSNPVASLSSFFSQFDRIWWIFFLGFVSFVFLYGPDFMIFFFWVLFLLYFCIDRIWWIFFLGFVSFVFLYWGMILYICLAAEKMWATSRKCVFYGIFKNTTKHQKIFFKTFFEMQPNTWKYFPFLKIAFPENKYFPENILHEPTHSLKDTNAPTLFFLGGG